MIFMKLTVLGSGTIFSGPKRKASSYLINGNNSSLLVDSGFGSLKQLQKCFDPLKIHNFLLTHLHLDHALNLPAFIAFKKQALYWKATTDKSQLNVFGPRGLEEFYSHLEKCYPYLADLPFKVELSELKNNKLKWFGFKIKSKPVQHKVNALGYRIKEKNKTIAFSGDSGYCEELIELGENVDLLVLECSFPSKLKRDYHLTPEQCGKIAKKANPKKLLLTHFYPAVEKTNILSEVRENFKGELLLARDLMELEV